MSKYQGSGGKKPQTPVITNDNLFSKDKVELLLGVGEGEIFGLEDGFKSFYAGEVPLLDKDGNSNLRELSPVQYKGLPTAETVTFQLGGESSTQSVGVNILQKNPVVRYTPEHYRGRFQKLDIRINIAQLYYEDGDGNVLNNTAEFRIEYKTARGADPWVILDFTNATPNTPTFPNLDPSVTLQQATHTDGKNKYQLTGKTGQGFVIDFRTSVTNLTNDDYIIRVTKFNPDTDTSATTKTACDIIFDSYQIINQPTRSYTNTAMIHLTGRASDQFSSLPDFYGIFKGLLTPVPSNRVENAVGSGCYVGTWNGTLTPQWHSNPAWVLYDLLNNPRYGMRRYAPSLNIYTQDFYDVGVYCDQAVQNSFGSGEEKRYTMNIVLAENQNGWETLENLAGAFDSVIYDDGEGNIRLKVDRWVEPRVLFTPETVAVEGFNYSFTDITTWYNSAVVSFNNPERGWQESRIKVINQDAIDQNGEIPLDFVAVGCISESEATRRARARLLTANTEKIIVNFTTTRLGLILDPLEIIYIADPLLGWGKSGRISHTQGLFIYLRDPIGLALSASADLMLQTETGLFQGKVVQVDPEGRILQVTTNTTVFLNSFIPEFAQFTIGDAAFKDNLAKPFRITAIEPSRDYNTFQITALEVNKDKYDVVGNSQDISIPITADRYFNLNLRQLFQELGYSTDRQYNSITFTFDGTQEAAKGSFLLICGSTTSEYGLTIGDWTGLLPVGAKPKLVFKGNVKIMGRGGKGGAGGYAYFEAPTGNGYQATVRLGRGENGQNGGNGLFLDYPVDIQLESGANVELLGGYGGGRGERGRLLAKNKQFASYNGDSWYNEHWFNNNTVTYPRVEDSSGNQSISGILTVEGVQTMFYAWAANIAVPASGGSGGWPFGEAGSSGYFNSLAQSGWLIAPNTVKATPNGVSATKTERGTRQSPQNYTLSNRSAYITSGVGAAGELEAVLDFPLQPQSFGVDATVLDFYNTSALALSQGSQGIGVVNHANLNISSLGAGSVLTYNTISGYTTLTG